MSVDALLVFSSPSLANQRLIREMRVEVEPGIGDSFTFLVELMLQKQMLYFHYKN